MSRLKAQENVTSLNARKTFRSMTRQLLSEVFCECYASISRHQRKSWGGFHPRTMRTQAAPRIRQGSARIPSCRWNWSGHIAGRGHTLHGWAAEHGTKIRIAGAVECLYIIVDVHPEESWSRKFDTCVHSVLPSITLEIPQAFTQSYGQQCMPWGIYWHFCPLLIFKSGTTTIMFSVSNNTPAIPWWCWGDAYDAAPAKPNSTSRARALLSTSVCSWKVLTPDVSLI